MGIYGAMKSIVTLPIAAALLLFGMSDPASAQNKVLIDGFNDWYAFSDIENGKTVCYMASLPQKSEGKYTQRGDTYILITHRPAEKTIGEISVRAGYTYKKGSETEARIDSNRPIKLLTNGGFSWARDVKTDRAMVAAMKAGGTLIVKGISSRGTLTTDTYSLKGFTAAYNAISKACKVK
ncbi:MAG: invasion associated locus B family protein [Rhodospirillales bacterium]|nr:invasion associated locus B family protein [Rhodospirillales bacterium]